MKGMKKLFTLIELIVVIVVLGVLAAIVIPNISSFKEEAKETAILSDARNIQTAVDMFMLEKDGKTPTNEKATLGNPQIVELYGLKPEYLRDTPKDNGAKFWLDENNTVWASMVDAPTNVNFDEGLLTWNTVDGAELYKIYKTEDATMASAKGSLKLEFIENVIPLNDSEPSKTLPILTKGTYLVTAIDVFNFESAPTKVNTSYEGYKEGPNKDFTVDVPSNEKPLAVMGVNPETNINTATTIVWSYSDSSDPDNDIVNAAEWKVNGVIKYSMPEKLSEGEYTIELRVQDEKGTWSNWTSKTIIVEKVSFTSQTFNFTGGFQTFTVPATGTYKLETWGAKGKDGASLSNYGYGGRGGYAYGEKQLTEGQVINVYVGGENGWNGGGSVTHTHAGNGGGATDIRILGSQLSNRIIVAGGGGGGGCSGTEPRGNGGSGGGLVGTNGGHAYNSSGGGGGTQTSGGAGGTGVLAGKSGSLGNGGIGSIFNNSFTASGAGGGGYYGGGSGGHGNGAGSGGGGGSSYIGGVTNGGTTAGINTGDGMAKITLVN